jgi:hypothetical protein
MQAPGQLDLNMYQGASWDYVLTWRTGDPAAPVNLTSFTARMQARESANADTTVLSITSGSGIALGGTAGTITLTRSAAETAAIPAGAYRYDLEVESAAGVVTRLIEGVLTVSREVTR